MLQYIEIGRLRPHPDNPRKDLGDLTELTESIKAKGVLQNLTVVPQEAGYCPSCTSFTPSSTRLCKRDDTEGERPPCSKWESKEDYTVVIGHRRLAAAKMAGLTEVPCVVSSMDKAEQVATMLLENIQRNDLTVYEQAQGFQMMLDLGETADSIAEKTGFSTKTVQRRIKLLELDQEKFAKAAKRGATLMDFAELEKIKDPELKNKVLDAIGTANFNYELKNAKDRERENEKRAARIAELSEFATQIESSRVQEMNLKQIKWFSLSDKIDFPKPDDAGQRKYFFTVSYYITLYAEPTESDKVEEDAEADRRKRKSERQNQLEQLAKRTFSLRFDFVKALTGHKKKKGLIAKLAVQSMLLTGYGYSFDGGMFLDFLGLEPDENEEFDLDTITDPLDSSPERVLLAAAYANMGDSERNSYHDWRGLFFENESLDLIYEYLVQLGYELSDEEKAYRDGTHELFQTSEA